jgi:signal transduction histidine kinase/CheY-like chemotaxis protein
LIEYVTTSNQKISKDQSDENSSSPPIPHVRIISRDLEQVPVDVLDTCIILREPKNKRNWRNLATHVNLITRQQKDIQGPSQVSASRKKSESENILEQLFHSVSVGMIHLDAHGVIKEVSSWVIEKFSETSTKEKLIGRKLTESVIGRSLGLEKIVDEALRGQDFADPDYRIMRGKYETVARLNLQAKPVYSQTGEVTGSLLIMEDTEETREILEKITQLQSLETVGSLAGSLTLELGQLLNIIRGHASYLSDRVEKLDPIRGDVTAIANAAETASELIARVGFASNVAAPEITSVNVNQAVRDVTAILSRISDQAIAFAIELEPKIKPVFADRVLIHLILINLLTNASDAMPQGGIVRIRTGCVHGENLEATGLKKAPEGAVWISIQDSGTGMTPEAKARACQAFFSTKEPGRHAGLGLALVKKIVHEFNGSINIESQAGRGATLTLYFPVASSSSLDSLPLELPSESAGELLLLVESEHLTRSMSRKLLETGGYRVLTAADGKEAVDLYHEHRLEVGLVIVDTVLSDRRWQEVVEKIRSIDPAVRILLAAGNTTETNIKEAIDKYRVEFIQKPFRMNSILEKVNTMLSDETLTVDI